jgi:hypothetical protein
MTILSKPIRRELPVNFDRSAWIAEMHGSYIRLRRKRTHRYFDIGWETVISYAIKFAVAAEQEERRKARKARRAA